MWEEAARSFARSRNSLLRRVLILVSTGCLAAAGCKKAPAPIEQAPKQGTSQASSSPLQSPSTSLVPNEEGAASGSGQGALTLPTSFGKRTGDLDEMAKARAIRALVIVSRSAFSMSQASRMGLNTKRSRNFRSSPTRN